MPSSSTPTSTLLIALSGPTSSGKTTIASALSCIFAPTTTLIHADDFYKTDSAIPIHPATGYQDWDCAAALDLPQFGQLLRDVKAGGEVPVQLVKQGGAAPDGVHANNTMGVTGDGSSGDEDEGGLSAAFLAELSQQARTAMTGAAPVRIVVVEGFLLFGGGVKEELGTLFDVKMLLRSTREAAEQRRNSRNGYVTLEGFWQDPEGYFEGVVWPNYVHDHAHLFEDGDVEGLAKVGIESDQVMIGPVADVGLKKNCEWVVTCIIKALEDLQK